MYARHYSCCFPTENQCICRSKKVAIPPKLALVCIWNIMPSLGFTKTRHWNTETSSAKGHWGDSRLKLPAWKETLMKLYLFSVRKRRLKEDLTAIYIYIVEAYGEDGARLFLDSHSDRARGRRHELHVNKIWLDIRQRNKNHFDGSQTVETAWPGRLWHLSLDSELSWMRTCITPSDFRI